MEQKHMCCDRLPTLSLKYPWFLGQNLEDDEILCALYDLMSLSRCQFPEFPERRIRGCFHGWVIMSQSHNVTWYLWNPLTSKTIRLPPLVLKDSSSESIEECFLSSPPNHPTSVLMLTTTHSPTIVLCNLRKRLRWKEITYAKQLKTITTATGDAFLHCLTSYNGKVCALISGYHIGVQVDIKQDVISLLSFGKLPYPFLNACPSTLLFLKGHRQHLFYIKLDFNDMPNKTLAAVYLFKLDTASMIWEEMEDLKHAIFFIDLLYDCSVFYRDGIASELGGYVHIFGGEIIYSYDVKQKTISLSPMSLYEQSSQWEHELQGDGECETPEDEIMVRDEENLESHLLNIPFDVLKMIMELCVGVEHLKFRATCKRCRLAAPMIRWRNERRLQTYSLISPWLVVLDKHGDIITFIDPMFGDKYFITTPKELIGDLQTCCSGYGWLLLLKCTYRHGALFFFNPFTSDIRRLPDAPNIDNFCFSDPPTSVDCVVVGLSRSVPSNVFIYIPSSSNHTWTSLHVDLGGTTPHPFCFPTIRDRDTYALSCRGALHVFLENPEGNGFTNNVVAEALGTCAQYFLLNCDVHHLVLVTVDEVGEYVQVFKLNDSSQKWEKIDSLGRHMIYICGTTCLCVEAKMPEMENKIYFPLLHSKSGKIVFYSLETCRYHTFNGGNIQQQCSQDFLETKYHVNSHAWIQPSWS